MRSAWQKIPLYCDEPTTPEFSAPATAVRCLLALARGAEMTENLTTLAKTGLCALSEEQVCALENYAYTWSPGAAAWRSPFSNDPRGFGAVQPSPEAQQELQNAETARQLLVEAVETLRQKVRGADAEQISRAVYFCLDQLGAAQQQAGQVEMLRIRQGIHAAEEAAREWNVVMELLDEMARLLEGQAVTVAEYEMTCLVCCCAPATWGTSLLHWMRWCWPVQAKCVWMRRSMCLCWGWQRGSSLPLRGRTAC